MRTIIGTAIGIVSALALFLVAQSRGGATAQQQLSSPRLQPISSTGNVSDFPAGPVLVNCGEGRRAMIRNIALNGQAVAQVDCVFSDTRTIYVDEFGRSVLPEQLTTVSDARLVRVASAQPIQEHRIVTERVVRQETPARRRVNRTRSWQKSALIIGSSSGAGAGIGALIGGKKGALIGAAVGGGAGTVYDIATRNNRR